MITLTNQKFRINRIKLIKELEKYPLFNTKIIKDIIKKDRKYAKLVLYRLKKDGLIIKIEKNAYTLYNDSVLIAGNLVWPCYLSCWTAIRYYNLTEQLPTTLFVVTPRSRNRNLINFENTKIYFIKTKPKFFFGFKKENYNNFTIFIAEPEKALIDSALYKKISFSEISSIIKENKKKINNQKLISYLIKINNKSLIKRFGYLLDKMNLDYYSKLKRFIDAKYIDIDYAKPEKGSKDKKWRIIENADL